MRIFREEGLTERGHLRESAGALDFIRSSHRKTRATFKRARQLFVDRLFLKREADGVDAVAQVGGGVIALAGKDMPEV